MKTVRWYNNSEKEIQLNINEPIPEGFVRGRLPKPKKIDTLKSIVSKEDLYQKFIVENVLLKDLSIIYGISNSDVRQLLNYYKITKDPKLQAKNRDCSHSHEQALIIGRKSSKTQKQNWDNKSQKDKREWSEKCRQAQKNISPEKRAEITKKCTQWYSDLNQQEKDTINAIRSNTLKQRWKVSGEEIQSKRKKTERQNRKLRLCRSVAEQKMYDTLIKYYSDVQYDVRVDDRYPYYCDFYIPDEDLFIELNAHPSHGRLPYSELSFEEYSNYPLKWVDVFARRDVEKQQTAKDNNLNYLMIYPQATLDENLNINNNHKLVELLYNSQK